MGRVGKVYREELLASFVHLFSAVKTSWLVVSTPLKKISQLGLLFPIYGKINNVPNHQVSLQISLHSIHPSDLSKEI
jgi:hypothetical protein